MPPFLFWYYPDMAKHVFGVSIKSLRKSLYSRVERHRVGLQAYHNFRRAIEPTLVSPKFGRIDWDNIDPDKHEEWAVQGAMNETLVAVACELNEKAKHLAVAGDVRGADLLHSMATEVEAFSKV